MARTRKQKQPIPPEQKYTRAQFNAEFPDDEACFRHVAESRFPGGMATCAKCGRQRKHHRVTGRKALACDSCGGHVYPMAGTIFEKSTTGLRLWFEAIYLMGSTRCGISAKQLQRETGVTYKTAWRIFRQIRLLLGEEPKLAGSRVEMDETYYGGHRKGFGSGPTAGGNKKTVVGAVERGGRVVARHTEDRPGATLLGMAREYVLPETMVYTDEFTGYEGLRKMPGMGYKHRRINHSAKVYVRGNVHTNTIEGFWSLVKRGIGGVYHAVGDGYLQSYLNEYSFRYNRRSAPEPIFRAIEKLACGETAPAREH
ncbi:MAG: IS1595 family transposase [Terriglobales bacterium]